jgi:hypothetical protein
MLICLLASCSSAKYPKHKKNRKKAPCDCPVFGQNILERAYYVAYLS